MRDRLIEIIANELGDINCAKLWATDITDRLLENGAIMPPVKVDTEVYAVTYNPYTLTYKIHRGYVGCIDIRSTGKYMIIRHQGFDDEPYFDKIVGRFDDFGKTVFLTREEAEKALVEVAK